MFNTTCLYRNDKQWIYFEESGMNIKNFVSWIVITNFRCTIYSKVIKRQTDMNALSKQMVFDCPALFSMKWNR